MANEQLTIIRAIFKYDSSIPNTNTKPKTALYKCIIDKDLLHTQNR